MLAVCRRCGAYRPDKRIEEAGPWAVCPACSAYHPFVMAPLLLVGGPSGSGKSTVVRELTPLLNEAVVLDGDILWREELDTPEDHYRQFYDMWLRLLLNVAQSGRPGVLVHAGAVAAENIRPCVHRRYFRCARYLALTASDEELRRRLASRPVWRGSRGAAFIESQILWSRDLKRQGGDCGGELMIVDTTDESVRETSRRVAEWIRRQLAQFPLKHPPADAW